MAALCFSAKMPLCTVRISSLECGQSIDMQLEWPLRTRILSRPQGIKKAALPGPPEEGILCFLCEAQKRVRTRTSIDTVTSR